MIRLRKSKKDDQTIFRLIKEELLPISRKSFPFLTLKRKEIYLRLKRGVSYVVGRNKWETLGFVHTIILGNTLWVDMLAVNRKHHRKGWGKQLLSRAELLGRKKGCSTICLYVDKSNLDAEMFYTSLGYISSQYYPQINSYLFKKSL